ncbi:hypothetical protein MAR_031755, partial [Mya arenaria]
GKTKLAFKKWATLTNNKWILHTISGYKIELGEIPRQYKIPKPYQFTESEKHAINIELEKFLDENIIEEVGSAHEMEFISNIFFRPKSNGKIRIILNLKLFNERYVVETLTTAIALMRKKCWFASVDLADAFYSIPVAQEDRPLLRFQFQNKKYQFCALVMGLSSSPRTIKLAKYQSETSCIVMLLDKYLSRTAGLRMGDKLMISTQKPHKVVSRDTISRWVKTIMIKFGLENKYGAHSTRAASTSTAKSAGVDLGTIIKTAGWTNAHTFAKFYDKEILSQMTVQDAVLSNLLVDS